MENVESRLWKHIKHGSPDVCWPWLTGTSKGRGTLSVGCGQLKRPERAYRLVWQYATGRGPLHRTEVVCHLCDNPICCNPFHLHCGTQKDNMAHRIKNHRYKYTEDEVRGWANARTSGWTWQAIGKALDIPWQTVYSYVCKLWRGIDSARKEPQ